VTLDQQQAYLAQISHRFEHLIREAVGDTGSYIGEFFELPGVKLRAVVRNQNDIFIDWMYGWGHSYAMTDDSDNRCVEGPIVEVAGNEGVLSPPEFMAREEFIAMAKEIKAENRGGELPGTFNTYQISRLFRIQSKRWRVIARAHVERVWDDTLFVLEMAARSAARNDNTAHLLISHLIGPEMETKRTEVLRQLDFVLQPYTKLHPITVDRDFLLKKLQLQQDNKFKEYISMIRSLDLVPGTEKEQNVVADRLKDQVAVNSLKQEEYVYDSRDMLGLMQLYYQVNPHMYCMLQIDFTSSEDIPLTSVRMH
jgi:hypothetical protein